MSRVLVHFSCGAASAVEKYRDAQVKAPHRQVVANAIIRRLQTMASGDVSILRAMQDKATPENK